MHHLFDSTIGGLIVSAALLLAFLLGAVLGVTVKCASRPRHRVWHRVESSSQN